MSHVGAAARAAAPLDAAGPGPTLVTAGGGMREASGGAAASTGGCGPTTESAVIVRSVSRNAASLAVSRLGTGTVVSGGVGIANWPCAVSGGVLSARATGTPGGPATDGGAASGTRGAGAGPGRAQAASPIKAGKNSLFSSAPARHAWRCLVSGYGNRPTGSSRRATAGGGSRSKVGLTAAICRMPRERVNAFLGAW